ncbi:MAG: hypothetical protein IT290_06615 [Deltaproteobacteria bacterium]|nr:hypothetical protein [Deltaproteobacteria bacterium]
MASPQIETYRQLTSHRLEELYRSLREHVRIGVVYSGNPDDPRIVANRSWNLRGWESDERVAREIAQVLTAEGLRFVALVADGKPLLNSATGGEFDLYWLVTTGTQGHASTCHSSSLLECLGVPYLGQAPMVSALLDDRVIFRTWLRGRGFPTPHFIVRGAETSLEVRESDVDFLRELRQHSGPFILRPRNGASEVHVLDSLAEINRLVPEMAERTMNDVVIEGWLEGPTYRISVAPPVFSRGEDLSIAGAPVVFAPLCTSGVPSSEHHHRMISLGTEIFSAAGASNALSLDLRFTEKSEPAIIEAESRPRAGSIDEMARSARASGFTHRDLVVSLFAGNLYSFLRARPYFLETLQRGRRADREHIETISAVG